MDIEANKDPIYFNEDSSDHIFQTDLRIRITSRNTLKQKSETYYSRIRSKINKKSYQLIMKLKNLLKKMQQENLIGDFLYNKMNLTTEQQFAFINTDIGEFELLKNMQLIYILTKKMVTVIDHLFNGILVRHKYFKYMIKMLKKLLKVLNTYNAYFDPTEKGILLNELYIDVELDEFEDQFLQKIDYFMKVVNKKKKQGLTEIVEVDDHTEEKKLFIEKLPENVKKARLEAEKTSFNEFDHKKGQFKEEIKVINEDMRELLRKHENSMATVNQQVQNLIDKLYASKFQPLATESIHKPSKDKDEFNDAFFEGIESSSLIIIEKPDIKAAKVIQRYWRRYLHCKQVRDHKKNRIEVKIHLRQDERKTITIDPKYSDFFTRNISPKTNDEDSNEIKEANILDNIHKKTPYDDSMDLFTKVIFLNSEILTKR